MAAPSLSVGSGGGAASGSGEIPVLPLTVEG